MNQSADDLLPSPQVSVKFLGRSAGHGKNLASAYNTLRHYAAKEFGPFSLGGWSPEILVAVEAMSRAMVENTSRPLTKPLVEALEKSEKAEIERLIKAALKNNFDDRVLKIVKNVLTQMYKAMWTRRSFWKDMLSASASD